MKNIALVLFILLSLSNCTEKPVVYDVIVNNVYVFDGTEDLGIVNLAISKDTIAKISSTKLEGDSIIDGSGKYIIPGLVNAHVHMWDPNMLRESFDAGVLTVLDLYDPWGVAPRMRAYRDTIGYSNYYGAGMGATVDGGHPTYYIPHPPNYPLISDSLSPKQFVKMAVESGSEVIKILRDADILEGDTLKPIPTLTFEQVEALINEARANNIPSIVHIYDKEDALKIASFKPSGFAHFWDQKVEITEEDKANLRESGVFFIPTLMLSHTSNLRLKYDTTLSAKRVAFEKETYLYPDSLFEQKIYEMHEAGIPLIAGTDPPNNRINYGTDLMRELNFYENAGMSLKEVLKTATGNAAKYLPIDQNGSLVQGGPASFLLLNKNPLETLKALDDIEFIFKNGMPYSPGNYKYQFEESPFPE